MSEEESKKLLHKRKLEEIENDEIINYIKKLRKWITDSNIHKFNVRKRMFKSRPDDTNIFIKQYRSLTLTGRQLEK